MIFSNRGQILFFINFEPILVSIDRKLTLLEEYNVDI